MDEGTEQTLPRDLRRLARDQRSVKGEGSGEAADGFGTGAKSWNRCRRARRACHECFLPALGEGCQHMRKSGGGRGFVSSCGAFSLQELFNFVHSCPCNVVLTKYRRAGGFETLGIDDHILLGAKRDGAGWRAVR